MWFISFFKYTKKIKLTSENGFRKYNVTVLNGAHFYDTFHKGTHFQGDIEKTDRPDSAESGQRSGRTTPRARASIYGIYIYS